MMPRVPILENTSLAGGCCMAAQPGLLPGTAGHGSPRAAIELHVAHSARVAPSKGRTGLVGGVREVVGRRRNASAAGQLLCECTASGGDQSAAAYPDSEAHRLTSEFMKFVAENAHDWPTPDPSPTHLMPPTAVVKIQMDALMRNDWPDPGAGVRTAYKFALPEGATEMKTSDVPSRPAKSWEASEKYLSVEQFKEVLEQPSYRSLIGCHSWEFCSPLTFHRKGDEHALQAVRVTFDETEAGSDETLKERVYTFILQKVSEGPYKGCWMVHGVRLGDYANV